MPQVAAAAVEETLAVGEAEEEVVDTEVRVLYCWKS